MYIHDHTCISPQQTFGSIDIESLMESAGNKLLAREPNYEGIPPGILRRMGKAVRMGVGAALPILKKHSLINGMIIGTANGGMEDCIKFLNQIIDYEEGMLTPGNFVQSTPNAIAAQMGLMTQNKSYNITHVHRGLAFENALLDVWMQLQEAPANQYLVGAVDEISSYNYNIDFLDGWYKKENVPSAALYQSQSPGSIAGEGAAMFLFNNSAEGAAAKIKGIHTIHTTEMELVENSLLQFMSKYAPDEKVSILISGENGDNRLLHYYDTIAAHFAEDTSIARYKHLSGEYPTSSSIALWLACAVDQWPAHCIKKSSGESRNGNILIYNNYKGLQHSFILVQKM